MQKYVCIEREYNTMNFIVNSKVGLMVFSGKWGEMKDTSKACLHLLNKARQAQVFSLKWSLGFFNA